MKTWTETERVELARLYMLAQTALAYRERTRYRRMRWASAEYAKAHDVSSTAAYKELDRWAR